MLARLRDWWDDSTGSSGVVKYVGSMVVVVALIYLGSIFLAAPLMQAMPPTEYRFDDGVRCYVKGGALSCVVVR